MLLTNVLLKGDFIQHYQTADFINKLSQPGYFLSKC